MSGQRSSTPAQTKILFVEDDEDDVFMIQRACNKAGLTQPREFLPNGLAAQEYLNSATTVPAETSSLPRLIFLDLNMPRMGGLAFLEWLRSQPKLRYIPVVVLTTSENPRDINAAYETGANAYLVKPSLPARFAQMLDSAAEFWLKQNLGLSN